MQPKPNKFYQKHGLSFQSKPTGIITPETYCEECEKKFITSRSLVQHIQRGHK